MSLLVRKRPVRKLGKGNAARQIFGKLDSHHDLSANESEDKTVR